MNEQVCFSYNTTSGIIQESSYSNCIRKETSEYICFMLGDFFDPISFSDISLGLVADLCFRDPNRMIQNTDGLFLVCLYQKESRKLFIIPDACSSPYILYYTRNGEVVYFSTNLKALLLDSGIHREINGEMASNMIKNFCIMGRETYLKDVWKVFPGSFLRIEYNDIRIMNHSGVILPRYVIDDPVSIDVLIEDFITKRSNTEVNIALSSGFDSNLLLYCADNCTVSKINTFTVGSECGKSEIPKVRAITEFYNNVDPHFCYVKNDLFDLPDIIWRLEGAVYENGTVLQYYLAKLVDDNSCSSLLCGECADEVMYSGYENMHRKHNLSYYGIEREPFNRNPFWAANLIVLKKSSVMMNSFGVHTMYPYKCARFVEYAKQNSVQNGNCKKKYKEECLNLFDERVGKLVSSSGGATDPRAVLQQTDLEAVIAWLRTMPFFECFSWSDKDICCNDIMQREDRESYEIASDILTGLGLELFNQLFVTGNYDGSFNEISMRLSVFDILGI